MIKLTYEKLNDPMFIEGLRVLVNTQFALKHSYWIGRIQDKVIKESKKAQKMWGEILDKRVEWEGEGDQKHAKDPKQLRELEKEFLAIEFDMGKINPVHVQDIHVAKLTPLQIMALEPILTGLDTLMDKESDGIEDEAQPAEGGKVAPIKKA